MRSLKERWSQHRDARRAPHTIYVGSHEDKLSRLASLRVATDDEGRTREDVQSEKAEGRGLYGGGPPSRLCD
jgi:hypothetical protein